MKIRLQSIVNHTVMGEIITIKCEIIIEHTALIRNVENGSESPFSPPAEG